MEGNASAEDASAENAPPPSAPRPAPPRAFIVHAPEDAAFVEGFLLPALDLDERDVLLSSRLALGAPLVDELARGARGTLTLLVLTPAFFECAWARFAEQLAQHRSLEHAEPSGDGDDAVIPLLVATCEVPLATRFRVSLDFRDADRDRWELHAARLRQRLHSSSATSAAMAVAAGLACPYPGMRPFTAEEVTRFHGRRREIDDLLARLRAGERELYVIGPSGSGKSSLVFAGLVPSLRQAAASSGAHHVVRAMRPGADPMAALAFVLSGVPDRPLFASRDHAPAASAGAPADPLVDSLLDDLLAQHPGSERVLLVIDQLEELFTIAGPPARAAFFAAIARLRRAPRLTLIFTMRADFYGSLMDSPWWRDVSARR